MMFRLRGVVPWLVVLLVAVPALGAQGVRPVAEQITAATQALPKEMRDGAGVMAELVKAMAPG